MSCGYTDADINAHPRLQPYIEQAARDKERAEQQKKDYDVRRVQCMRIYLLTSLQNKKADSGSGGEEDDDE